MGRVEKEILSKLLDRLGEIPALTDGVITPGVSLGTFVAAYYV